MRTRETPTQLGKPISSRCCNFASCPDWEATVRQLESHANEVNRMAEHADLLQEQGP